MGTMESLVAALEANTASNVALTAALAAGGGAAATGAKTTTTPKKETVKKTEAPKSTFTAEQVRDKFIELKDKTDEATAKSTIEAQGVKKLAELVADPTKWDAAMTAADEAIEAAGGDDDGGL